MPSTGGFNFRATSGFVTDPAGTTYVLDTDTYPVTRNGFTFGWLDTPGGGRDRTTFSDARDRMAGINFGQAAQRFKVDLPGGAGTTDVRLAMGDAGGAQTQMQVKVKDNTTVRLTIGPHDTATSNYYDASDTVRTSETDWINNNAAATGLSMSSGVLVATLEGPGGVSNTTLAHLFVSHTAAGAGDTQEWIGQFPVMRRRDEGNVMYCTSLLLRGWRLASWFARRTKARVDTLRTWIGDGGQGFEAVNVCT